jgi:hypothetical protein
MPGLAIHGKGPLRKLAGLAAPQPQVQYSYAPNAAQHPHLLNLAFQLRPRRGPLGRLCLPRLLHRSKLRAHVAQQLLLRSQLLPQRGCFALCLLELVLGKEARLALELVLLAQLRLFKFKGRQLGGSEAGSRSQVRRGDDARQELSFLRRAKVAGAREGVGERRGRGQSRGQGSREALYQAVAWAE